ncbi:MAG: transcription termination/antitermination protein NusG, partial [Clostridia bacterium]|nr:transcription termination/antitermination protein NusG [Clostridia bacterium]
MALADSKWYVIHTYSGYEMMVKDSLEKLIENNNLQENIYDIQIPTEETLEEKANGKKKVVERKKFPSYVFLKMIYSNDIWYLVTNTRGVTGFVGPQGRPMPLTDEEVARMGLERPKSVD